MGAWQLMEQKGTLISQPWGSFPQGLGCLCKAGCGKKALPALAAGLSWGWLPVGDNSVSMSPFPPPCSLVPGGLWDLPQVLMWMEEGRLWQLTAEPSLAWGAALPCMGSR